MPQTIQIPRFTAKLGADNNWVVYEENEELCTVKGGDVSALTKVTMLMKAASAYNAAFVR